MRPKKGLTERQNQVFEYIQTFIRTNKKSPTLTEIGEAFEIKSLNGVSKTLQALVKKGYISRKRHEPRGISLVKDLEMSDRELPSFPFLHKPCSRQPELMRRRATHYVTIDPLLLGSQKECVVCRSWDDGMADAGIRKGDFLVVREKTYSEIPDGSLVVCLEGNTAIAREFARTNGSIRLSAASRHYTTIQFNIDDDSFYVLGELVSVMRKLPPILAN